MVRFQEVDKKGKLLFLSIGFYLRFVIFMVLGTNSMSFTCSFFTSKKKRHKKKVSYLKSSVMVTCYFETILVIVSFKGVEFFSFAVEIYFTTSRNLTIVFF